MIDDMMVRTGDPAGGPRAETELYRRRPGPVGAVGACAVAVPCCGAGGLRDAVPPELATVCAGADCTVTGAFTAKVPTVAAIGGKPALRRAHMVAPLLNPFHRKPPRASATR